MKTTIVGLILILIGIWGGGFGIRVGDVWYSFPLYCTLASPAILGVALIGRAFSKD